jgi:uncharacterized protein with FMN-binding domain
MGTTSMKRIVLAIAGTVAGLAALLSFKSHSALSSGALPRAGLPSTTPSTSVPSTPGTSSAPSSPSRGRSSTSTTTRTIAGQAVQTQYGVVQVQAVVSGGKIKNVSFLQLTAYDPRSQEINSAAAPILLQQTLAAQSSQIDGVSGATYTSEGYVQSLQSALDQAGIR